jgi:serine/threonine protein phosphatase PrpC
MGCSNNAKAGQPSQNQEVVPQLRRRLSLGEIGDDDSADVSPKSTLTEQDRSLIAQLTQEQLFSYVRTQGGRRYSLSSSTDNLGHLVNSFASKQVKLEGEAQFDSSKEHVGFACKKGLKPEAPNQDSFLIVKIDDEFALYGVFDGHGRKGHDVSNFVKDSLPKILLSQDVLRADPQTALLDTFEKTQTLLVKATAMNTIDATRSGTTCSVVLHALKERMLYIAHVGDSRVVLGRQSNNVWQAVDLTVDHKPDLPEERARIEKAGGVVIFDGGWNYRVFAKDKIDSRGKRYPGLNMSRAMGDLNGFNDAGISAIPDVNKREVESSVQAKPEDGNENTEVKDAKPEDLKDGSSDTAPERQTSKEGSTSSRGLEATPSVSSHEVDLTKDRFLLLCSDGVWEFTSSEEAVKEVAKFPPDRASQAAEHLSALAWDRWIREMEGQVVDDITALVIHFS